LKSILEEFELNLIENDVALSVASFICEEIEKRLEGIRVSRLEDRKQLVNKALREVILEVLTPQEPIELPTLIKKRQAEAEPFLIVFAGINGTGKTTTIAKMAKFLTDKGFSTVLACSDTYRAGSIEQLDEHARRLGVRMIRHQYGSDPAAVAYDSKSHAKAKGVDVVLIDTAGRMQTNKNLIDELSKIKRVVNPDLTLLVVDALTGNDAVLQAEEFHKNVGIDGTIMTKVDADTKGGAALSVAYVTKKPILFVGTGQSYKDLEEFQPERFVELMLD